MIYGNGVDFCRQVDGGIVKLGVSDDRVIRCGGAGRKVLMVARGEAECYLYPCKGTNKWDTCAPEALLRAANVRCLLEAHFISYRSDSILRAF